MLLKCHLVVFTQTLYCCSEETNALKQQLQLYTLILGAEVGQSWHNLIWLLYDIASFTLNFKQAQRSLNSAV